MSLNVHLKRVLLEIVVAIAGFEVIVVGGIALFMVAAIVLGYFPYSDARLGPGWYGPSQTIRELPMVWGWLRASPAVPLVYGAVVVLVVKALSLVPRLPRGVARGVGALLASCGAILWVDSSGSYSKVSQSVGWFALALALVYGAWFLPRVLYARRQHAA